MFGGIFGEFIGLECLKELWLWLVINILFVISVFWFIVMFLIEVIWI